VWLSGAVREFLEAYRELGVGVERDPGVGEGHEGMLRAGVPIFLQKGRPECSPALGQLTAGIAHEIKNPLNFVNNFAGISVELLDELKEAAAPAMASLGEDTRAEIDEIVEMLSGNLVKIAQHGSRADGIVKSMLAIRAAGAANGTPSI
jgi:signal transduction histidine kinase